MNILLLVAHGSRRDESNLEAIQICSEMGATHVTVLPYFLSAGVHINRDIPGEIEKASQNYPDLHINVTNYFGSRDEIAELLMKTAIDG